MHLDFHQITVGRELVDALHVAHVYVCVCLCSPISRSRRRTGRVHNSFALHARTRGQWQEVRRRRRRQHRTCERTGAIISNLTRREFVLPVRLLQR